MKDTYYFTHDYNARNDEKIKQLIRKHGILGYGIFWAIIEDLYNNANALRTDYEGIAFDLRTKSEIIKSIINDFDLFIIENDFFYSNSIKTRLEEREQKSTKARLSAQKRWDKKDENANALPTQSECNAIKEKKEKEKKEKEILKSEFENFRKIYPGTKLGIDREFENMIKKHSDYKDVIPKLAFIINNQIHHKALEKQKGLFVPVWKNLSTWINNRCWEEEYTTNQLNTTQIAKQPMTIERYKELFSQD